VRQTAEAVDDPFTVGGALGSVEGNTALLRSWRDKVEPQFSGGAADPDLVGDRGPAVRLSMHRVAIDAAAARGAAVGD